MKSTRWLSMVPAAFLVMTFSPALADDLTDELVAIEKSQWKAWEQEDGEAFRGVLTEDVVFIVAGLGMTEGRDAIVADNTDHDCNIANLEFADFEVRQLTADTAILTYITSQDTTCEGVKLPNRVYSQSVFVRKDGKWLTASYQETPLE